MVILKVKLNIQTLSEVKFIDASSWQELSWYSSGGTRAKRVLQDLDGKEWYFKCSEKKPAKDGKPEKYYKYEFWSEIIAYQVGKSLGLNILEYQPAINQGEMGCISPNMIQSDQEQLIEVGRFMVAINPDFIPEDYHKRNQYNFQLLEQTLDHFNLTEYWSEFFKTIIFDGIIGNTDRHQENWAFIGKIVHIPFAKLLIPFDSDEKHKVGYWINKIYKNLKVPLLAYFTKEPKNPKLLLTFDQAIKAMAQIYDSGSSLARELSDDMVNQLLSNENKIEEYILNGKSEIHWDNKKLSHFEFIENIANSSYQEEICSAAGFLNEWDEQRIIDIVNGIDNDIPEEWKSYSIPQSRKFLVIKLLTLRFARVNDLLRKK